ncbi:uncharacterized protein PHALS_11531 [Plasmopara halstedii]|uniref:Uncharacterized protein n=1 Tax=Plasmopara halstedii TaxID=4781 RepID=A0A0P1A683_PLAHL|nr:uncharacterized protein PHALS_11531 [Plasmopara halstedii]CEG35663.1 hypothetical protein PHALS_11531 [Plasmopara halstedii]|eukprot:XP_024572032.1 hypothetical protein PHALS_11531 [Plasmopara halstedii]
MYARVDVQQGCRSFDLEEASLGKQPIERALYPSVDIARFTWKIKSFLSWPIKCRMFVFIIADLKTLCIRKRRTWTLDFFWHCIERRHRKRGRRLGLKNDEGERGQER